MEWMGWTDIGLRAPPHGRYRAFLLGKEPPESYLRGIPPGKPDGYYARLPDLSLDLLASAEAMLGHDDLKQYIGHLTQGLSHRHDPMGFYVRMLRATKEQRLQALLRTVGRWVDGA